MSVLLMEEADVQEIVGLDPLELLTKKNPTPDLANKRGRCVCGEETRKDRNTKNCSAHRAWGAGRLRPPERASDTLGISPLFCAGLL